jgi:hypothetical protein
MKNFLTVLLAIILIISCKSTQKTAVQDKVKITMEAEDFILKDCSVVENSAASNGKAVKIENKTSEGSKDIVLKSGEYVLQLVIFAKDKDQDTLIIRIGPHEIKAFTKNFNEFNYCRVFLNFSIKEKAGQPITVSFAALKTGMLVDKIEIIKRSNWVIPYKY